MLAACPAPTPDWSTSCANSCPSTGCCGASSSAITPARLRFEEVQALAGDNEASPLFRLKERCHGLFRAGEVGGAALFDLAVGSLFHEAMKLRENLYQLEVYAPKVERARARAGPGSEGLFEEFERILVASRVRLAEALAECEALLEQTRRQFQALLASHRDNGLVIRYLIANAGPAEAVLGEPLDSFFARICGDAASAYAARGALVPRERLLRRGAPALRRGARARSRPRGRAARDSPTPTA